MSGWPAHDAWLAAALAAIVAAAVALAAHAVLLPILRRVARSSVTLSMLLEGIARSTRPLLAIVAVQFVWGTAPDDLPFISGVRTVTGLLLIGGVTWVAMRAVAAVTEAVVRLHPSNVSDNLEARRVQTQTRVLARAVSFFVLLAGVGLGLMSFPHVRQLGASLLASAGVAGLVAGLAARPVLGNLISGLQIALTQPLRLDDVVIVEGEFGRVEEITSTYIVLKIWDERRLVVPLAWVIEHPFQNWSRRETQLLVSVFLWVDYRVRLGPLRAELQRVCAAAPEWDRRVALLQVVETAERAVKLRVLVSAADASRSWDLQCRVREALIDFLQREEPEGLPRLRAEVEATQGRPPRTEPAPPPSWADGSASRPSARPDRGARDPR